MHNGSINTHSVKLSDLNPAILTDLPVQDYLSRFEKLTSPALPRSRPFPNQAIQAHLTDEVTNTSEPGLKESPESPCGITIGHPGQEITNEAGLLLSRLSLRNLSSISLRQ